MSCSPIPPFSPLSVNPSSPTASSQQKNLQSAADTLGVQLRVVEATSEQEFDDVFKSVAQLRPTGLVFTSDPYFAFRSEELAALAVRYDLPGITQSRDFPNAGGLMSYGGDFTQSHRRAGIYTGRILNGEKPADLPVQLVTKVELFINLKAANGAGHHRAALAAQRCRRGDRIIDGFDR